MTNVTHKFLPMYLFLFLTLHMFRAYHAYHQERQIVSIQPLVTVTLCWWPCHVQVGSSLPTCTLHSYQHTVTATRGCIDTICLSWWWARCARNMWRVKNKNKYMERNLCVTLVVYQESLDDAQLTKYKKLCTSELNFGTEETLNEKSKSNV